MHSLQRLDPTTSVFALLIFGALCLPFVDHQMADLAMSETWIAHESVSNLLHPDSGVFYGHEHAGFYGPRFAPYVDVATPAFSDYAFFMPHAYFSTQVQSSVPQGFGLTYVAVHGDGSVFLDTRLFVMPLIQGVISVPIEQG